MPNPPAHPNPFFNPNLINWNWDDVIVISSDDEDDGEEEPIPSPTVVSQVFVPGRKRVYCLVHVSSFYCLCFIFLFTRTEMTSDL